MAENIESIVNEDPRPTGLAKNYPIVLNGVEFPYFKTWNVVRNDYVTTHETEGGTQEDVIARKGRRSISASTTCLQPLAAKLIALADLDSFEVKYYDVATDAYVTINARVGAGSMSYSLKTKSANLNAVNGVWTVTFTLEEF